MQLITFNYFLITFLNIWQMFSTVWKPGLNIFKCLNQAVLKADANSDKRTKESIRIASNFTEQPRLEKAKDNIVHIKTQQTNKMNIIQHLA